MNIAIVCGARPNLIKVAPLLRTIHGNKNYQSIHAELIYVGTTADATLDATIFSDLAIAPPSVYLGVECENLNELTGRVMSAFEHYLQTHPTDVVLVVDDLASTMAVAIVTKKAGVRLAHIAAGTRSFDITMPKEINRLVIDGLSDVLFTAGASNNSIANREGAELSKVYMVGNILMDNLRFIHQTLRRPPIFDNLQLEAERYIVFTLNRKLLIEQTQHLRQLLQAIVRSVEGTGIRVIAPLRQRAARVVEALLADEPQAQTITLVPPQGYLAFAYLAAHARGIITDSGNVAEEATFNQVACITLNSYTEHIETVKQGTNVLVGENPDLLHAAVDDMVAGRWKTSSLPERWDGRTAERILQILY